MLRSIHIEGIPGSGKSTTSKKLCEVLQNKGIDASWWLEESTDHPVMPKELRAQSAAKNFPDICLNAWRAFLASSTEIAVLDGYVFQNTIRFLFANLVSRREIDDYFNKWQQIGADTSILFLTVENPSAHYEVTLPERGDDWTGKLFSYVERTPFGKANNLKGKDGFIDFWSRYQELCTELIDTAHVPVDTIKSRSWNNADLEELANKRSLI